MGARVDLFLEGAFGFPFALRKMPPLSLWRCQKQKLWVDGWVVPS